MNYAAHVTPNPVAEHHPEVEEISRALDSFVSETTLAQTPFNPEDSLHPLWAFPEERTISSSTPIKPSVRRWTTAALLALVAVTVFVATFAGLWWRTLIPGSKPVATIATAPVMEAPGTTSRGTSNELPAQLTPSLQLAPSAELPVAPLPPPAAPVLLPAPTPSSSNAPPPTRQLIEPIATAPVAEVHVPARSPASISDIPATSAPPMQLPPAPRPSTPSATAVRPEPAALATVAARTEHSEIERTLAQYRSAYQLLDAQAAQAVWPSVDVRALARAFDTLASQQLAFENCEMKIAGESATAECRGSATYAPKVGSRGPRLEARQWTFRLQKEPEGWKIQSAQTRR